MSRWIRTLIVAAGILAFSVATALAETKVIVNTDFSLAKYKVNFKNTETKDITGKLPMAWSDNSDWNTEITVSYTPMTEDGSTFVRMAKDAGVRAQLANNISRTLPAGTYRFTMEVKSDTATVPELGIRQTGEPYTFLWATKPTLSDSWETIEEEFDIDPSGAKVGIYLCMEANGSMDIRRVKLEQLL